MSLQCFYKLGVIAYFNLNQEYIAEALCTNKEEPLQTCHGQCFLKTNLNLADESSSQGADMPPTKQQIEFPVFVVSELAFKFNNGFTTIERNFRSRFSLPLAIHASHFVHRQFFHNSSGNTKTSNHHLIDGLACLCLH